MRQAVHALVLGTALTWAVNAHAVEPARGETTATWAALSEVHPWSRSVRIEFSYPSCGVAADEAVSRIVVKRKRRTVVLTVLMKTPADDSDEVCPQVARVYRRTVSLKGRLGPRSITDGATGRVRVKRPRADDAAGERSCKA